MENDEFPELCYDMDADDLGISLYPWCGLCQNDIVDADRLSIVSPVRDDGQQEVRSGYRHEAGNPTLINLETRRGGPFYRLERGDDSSIGGMTACHDRCIEAVTEPRVSEVLQRTVYEFLPSERERRRKAEWLLAKCAHALSTSGKWLPPEVSVDIARLCSEAFALPCVESVTPQKPGFMVTLKDPIWARFINFEGVAYVAELSNQRFPDVVMAVPLPRTAEADALYVAQDHLGIRRIILGNSEKPPRVSQQPGLWWWASLVSPEAQLHGHSDGIKLRKLSSTVEEVKCQQLWAIPHPPKKQVRIHDRGWGGRIPRFNHIECNHPDIVGYSACWYRTVKMIHAHFPGEDLTFYANTTAEFPSGVWLYMPMDKGELIIEFWEYTPIYPWGYRTMVVKTSKGRVWTIGPHGNDSPAWTLLDKCPSRIYIEETLDREPRLGFESPRPGQGHEAPRLPDKNSNPGARDDDGDDDDFDDPYLHTSAPLDDVTQIALCLKEPCIMGILLRYGDGRERTVGSVRLDLLGPFIDVGDSTGLSFRMGDPRTRLVEVTPSTAGEPDGEYEIPWCGNLVWWFESDKCEITHEKDGVVQKVISFDPHYT